MFNLLIDVNVYEIPSSDLHNKNHNRRLKIMSIIKADQSILTFMTYFTNLGHLLFLRSELIKSCAVINLRPFHCADHAQIFGIAPP
jgi:hypothetical protein